MSGPQYLRTPTVLRLPQVLEEVRSGLLRIPPFQREFVWNAEQRLLLMSSIRQGLPTGSLMVWRTRRSVRHVGQVGPYRLAFSEHSGEQYLLDGLQRVTTLFSALGGALWTREGLPVPAPGVDDDPPDGVWSLSYDLEAEDFIQTPASDAEDLPPAGTLFPLDLVLDDNGYDNWREEHRPSREVVAKIRALRSAFQDYLIPVTPLVTDDIRIVTTTFKRVNSSGTPMDDVHMARALTWSEDFDLLAEISRRSAELEDLGWSDLEPTHVLKVVAAVAGLDPTDFNVEDLANRVKTPASGDPKDAIDAAFRAIRQVILALRTMGFVAPTMLPAAYALVLGAAAVYRFTDKHGTFGADQDLILRRWIAQNLLYERYSGPAHVLRGLQRHLEEDLGARKRTGRRRSERQADEAKKFNLTWARSRAIAAALAHLRPRASTGVEYADPAALLATHGSNALPMLLQAGAKGLSDTVLEALGRNRLLGPELSRPANRLLCDPADAMALRDLLTTGSPDLELLRSHAMDAECVRKLQIGDLHGFIARRREHLRQAEVDWAKANGATNMIVKKGPSTL